MKVVGLTSGGKDSWYSLMMCIKYGHDVVCLANLYPPNGDKEEMDSYMYQCVAHTGLQVHFFPIVMDISSLCRPFEHIYMLCDDRYPCIFVDYTE